MARISAPHFVAGVDIQTQRAAPVVSYMRSRSLARIVGYCRTKGWKVEYVA